MGRSRNALSYSLSATLLLIALPAGAHAQVISIKTIPVATGDQGVILPSQTLGMGSLSIAVDDPFLDPFVNPAKGYRNRGFRLFGATSFYSVSERTGSGRTWPAGIQFRRGPVFGSASVALQELVPAVERTFPTWWDPPEPRPSAPLKEGLPTNRYAYGALGMMLPGTDLALAGSISWAGLDALAGTELLYDGSESVKQWGHTGDYRLGLAGELTGERTVEALLFYSQFEMTHSVTYEGFAFPIMPPIPDEPIRPPEIVRTDRQLDRSGTYGIHLGYVKPGSVPGTRIGGIFTFNRKFHPKLPSYDVPTEAYRPPRPKDPGNSAAFNIGVGISQTRNRTTLGAELIYEPIWSHTWAEAPERTATSSGGFIPEGGKTIDNKFRFSNLHIRMGFDYRRPEGGVQFGLQLSTTHYELHQSDRVELRRYLVEEGWAELTTTWGAHLDFGEFQVWYAGRMTTGLKRPGLDSNPWVSYRGISDGELVISPAADIIYPGTGAMVGESRRIMTHQISVVVPFGR